MATQPHGTGPFDTMFRDVPATGVIDVMRQAALAGYNPNHPDWVNLGQGAPETGEIDGAPARVNVIHIPTDNHHEYAPVGGMTDLRDAIAELYNERYRKGRASKYTRENVAIAAGGRTALTRIASSLVGNVGHFLPDYTAYEELLGVFGSFCPIPLPTSPNTNFSMDVDRFGRKVVDMGLSSVLVSNPRNPCGGVMYDEVLDGYVGISRKHGCALILDEFYAQGFVYLPDGRISVSAAQYVDDVNRDPVLIVDGLTKGWRYPGWRVSWTLGPKEIISRLENAGSFLDGGCPHPIQHAAIPMVLRENADAEARAIQTLFRRKRDFMVPGLNKLGIKCEPPEGSFYVWGDVSDLPDGINTGRTFFREALKLGVICVPGDSFDVNPGHRRPDRDGNSKRRVRFSFGPCESKLELGMTKLSKLFA